MAHTAADILIATLIDWGVDTDFGMPGDGINGIMESLRTLGLRYPAEAGLVGDSRATLGKLLPLLARNENRGFLEKAQENMRDWWKRMDERGTRDDKPMKPQVVSWELSPRLRDDAIISCDSGTIATWFARQIRIKRGQMCSLSDFQIIEGYKYFVSEPLLWGRSAVTR